MKRLSITQLVPGMTVAEDVYDLDHELLIQKGTILTDKLITKLDLYGIHFCRRYHTTRTACGGSH